MYRKKAAVALVLAVTIALIASCGRQEVGERTTPKLVAENTRDARLLTLKGTSLPDQEAKKLEDELRADPDDLSARTKLLGYYSHRQYHSKAARKARQMHAMWIIEHRPNAMIAGLPEARFHPILDGLAYRKAEKLWLKQVETYTKNTSVLGNAANFFLIHDLGRAEELLKRAQVLEPNDPKWSQRLGHLYDLQAGVKSGEARKEAATKSLAELETALKKTSREMDRFYMLSRLARAAFDAGAIEKAKAYASELLDKASLYKNDWNYGNAVHHGNLILGRLALRASDVEKAKEYLIAAGKTPGSPQLNSFGPNMTLAKELLDKGERGAVLEYFELCGKFWKDERLKKWTSAVKRGGIPDFGANLRY